MRFTRWPPECLWQNQVSAMPHLAHSEFSPRMPMPGIGVSGPPSSGARISTPPPTPALNRGMVFGGSFPATLGTSSAALAAMVLYRAVTNGVKNAMASCSKRAFMPISSGRSDVMPESVRADGLPRVSFTRQLPPSRERPGFAYYHLLVHVERPPIDGVRDAGEYRFRGGPHAVDPDGIVSAQAV